MTPSTITMILAGLTLLIFISVRQLSWQSVSLARMIKLPVILAGIGLIMAGQALDSVSSWHVGGIELGLIGLEVGLAVVGGWLMGRVTEIAAIDGKLKSRLQGSGLAIWFGFLAIRIGAEVFAHVDHLALAASTPLIFFMIAIVKASQALTVRARIAQHRQSVPQPAGGALEQL